MDPIEKWIRMLEGSHYPPTGTEAAWARMGAGPSSLHTRLVHGSQTNPAAELEGQDGESSWPVQRKA